MKAIIYGGSFNPPTNAHLAVTLACCELAQKLGAEMWLLPSGDRTDKTISVGSVKRSEYLDAFVAELAAFGYSVKIERYELENDKLTETAETVEALARLYPQSQFIWVFGADSFLTMKDWKDGQKLWDILQMIAVPRSGYKLPELPKGTKVLDVHAPVVSSTQVRDLLTKGKPVRGLVPGLVADVLEA